MKAIDLLKEEHQKILLFLDKMEEECVQIIEGKDIDFQQFHEAILFIKEFADGEHHRKEEDILFSYMLKYLGSTGKTLVTNGMMVEHDLARLSVFQLEEALLLYKEEACSKNKLDIIANMMNYIYILRRHIDKEDKLVYTFAEKNLSTEVKAKIDQEFNL